MRGFIYCPHPNVPYIFIITPALHFSRLSSASSSPGGNCAPVSQASWTQHRPNGINHLSPVCHLLRVYSPFQMWEWNPRGRLSLKPEILSWLPRLLYPPHHQMLLILLLNISHIRPSPRHSCYLVLFYVSVLSSFLFWRPRSSRFCGFTHVFPSG